MEVEDRKFVGFGKRFVAYMIDIVIIMFSASIVAIVLFFVLSFSSEEAVGQMVMVVYFIVYVSYFILMESSVKQATLGKRLFKIKVINENGTRLSLINSLGRTLGRLLSGAIMGLGYVMILFTKDKQGLHDKLAKTYVVGK